MPIDRLNVVLDAHVKELEEAGTAKGAEAVVTGVRPASGTQGPRFRLEGEGDREFIRMNSNSYLGLGLRRVSTAVRRPWSSRRRTPLSCLPSYPW